MLRSVCVDANRNATRIDLNPIPAFPHVTFKHPEIEKRYACKLDIFTNREI